MRVKVPPAGASAFCQRTRNRAERQGLPVRADDVARLPAFGPGSARHWQKVETASFVMLNRAIAGMNPS
jgi:hypothetical protein